MTGRTIRLGTVERFAHDGTVDRLALRAGINVLVGLKDTGKTAWLNTISYLLGDTGSPEEALGVGIATKFDSARVQLIVGGADSLLLERRWKDVGSKHKIFINGEGISSEDFSTWIHATLGIPILRFPRGNPYSGATWPELSWRMLFRHLYREERFWADLADKQPEKEQHACLLQFLGVAHKVYPQELGEEVRERQRLLSLRARKEQFEEVLRQTAQSLLADPSISEAPTRESIDAGIERLRSEIGALQSERDMIIEQAISSIPSHAATGLSFERELAAQQLEHRRRAEEIGAQIQRVEHRVQELSVYRTTIAAELTRIKRAEVAEEVFRPLSVTCCPHCDQAVSPNNADPGDCFVCHQKLPWEAPQAWQGAKRRLAFEHDQLVGEDQELRDLADTLASELHGLRTRQRDTETTLAAIDVQLRPTRSAVAAMTPPGLQVADTRIGQLEERAAQLRRLRETLEQHDALTADIDKLAAKVQAAATHIDDKGADIPFDQLSETLTDGVNEYLNLLKEGDPQRWEHQVVRFRISERYLKVLVGQTTWSSVGATSAGLLLLGYHYALLKHAGREGFNCPGLSMIDFPMTLADGSTTASKENYLVEPFVTLASANPEVQAIICGRTFKGLTGVTRLQLDHVWAQGQEPEPDISPGGSEGIEFMVHANFHTGQEQIMMVLHHAEVVRLGTVLLDLGAAVAAGRTWPGKAVAVKWSGGTYETKLIHHKDNGNVKFTVRKREARRLWEFLNEQLRGSSPSREFRAVYTVKRHAPLDEVFVDITLPDESTSR